MSSTLDTSTQCYSAYRLLRWSIVKVQNLNTILWHRVDVERHWSLGMLVAKKMVASIDILLLRHGHRVKQLQNYQYFMERDRDLFKTGDFDCEYFYLPTTVCTQSILLWMGGSAGIFLLPLAQVSAFPDSACQKIQVFVLPQHHQSGFSVFFILSRRFYETANVLRVATILVQA